MKKVSESIMNPTSLRMLKQRTWPLGNRERRLRTSFASQKLRSNVPTGQRPLQ